MRKLDIIVTHYNEPWDIGEKFFNMLTLQRDVDFDEIRVTIVHDGGKPFDEKLFKGYPYEVQQTVIAHAGISAARNYGIRIAEAEWIMFCDFDDMFASAYSLRHILGVLPAKNYDVLWGQFYAEDKLADGMIRLNLRHENSVFIHCKLFRRQFLLDNKLTFPEDLEFNEDSAFCAIAFAICDYKRVGEIKAETPLYIWAYREGSLTATQENRARAFRGMYFRNKKVVEAFKERLGADRYQTMVCRACYDAYHMLNIDRIPEEMEPVAEDFRTFWKEHKADFLACDRDLRLEAAEASAKERAVGDREEVERWGELKEMVFRKEIPFGQWVRQIEAE